MYVGGNGCELMLAERISLEAICRVLEIKPYKFYSYMDELYEEVSADLACSVTANVVIEFVHVDWEADKLWSFWTGKPINSGFG